MLVFRGLLLLTTAAATPLETMEFSNPGQSYDFSLLSEFCERGILHKIYTSPEV